MSTRLVAGTLALCAACTTVSQLGALSASVSEADGGGATDASSVALSDTGAMDSDARSPQPVVFPGVASSTSGPRSIAAGNGYTCAIGEGYTLYCWGTNNRGQLGAGDTAVHVGPVDTGLRGVVDVAAGEQNTCAVLSSGDAYCWGDTRQGQLGNVSTAPIVRPMQIALNGSAATVSVGGAAGKASISFLMRDGTVYGMGDNTEYLARGASGPAAPVPGLTQTNFASLTQLSLGARRACGIWLGRVMCWGSPYVGDSFAFGIGDEGFSIGNSRVSVGYDHACALSDDGRVRCVGNNASGQLGVASFPSNERFPADALPLTGISDVAVGRSRSCVIAGVPARVHCFGAAGPALGAGPSGDAKTPRVVAGLPDGAQHVAVGVSHACAMVQNTGVYCWGDNASGELGRATPGSSAAPLTVLH